MFVWFCKDYYFVCEELLLVIELDLENIDVLFLFGELEELEGDFEFVCSYYLMLFDVDEDYLNVYYCLGMIIVVYFEEECVEVVKYFRKVVKQDRSNYDVLYQYVLFLNEVFGKFEKVVKYFKKILKVNVFYFFVYYDMVLVYYQLGEYWKVVDVYQKVIQINLELKMVENDEVFVIVVVWVEGNIYEK